MTIDSSESDVIRRELDPSVDEPTTEVANALADIEDEDPTEFTDMWGCTDDVLTNLFSDPPSPEAEMRVVFNFEGYRISVHQDGYAEFRQTP